MLSYLLKYYKYMQDFPISCRKLSMRIFPEVLIILLLWGCGKDAKKYEISIFKS